MVTPWIQHWPADLAVPSLIPRERILFNHKKGSIAHSLSLSPSHCPDMINAVEKGCKIASHQFISLQCNKQALYKVAK